MTTTYSAAEQAVIMARFRRFEATLDRLTNDMEDTNA